MNFGVVISRVVIIRKPRDAYRRMNAAQVGGRHQGSPRWLLQCRLGRNEDWPKIARVEWVLPDYYRNPGRGSGARVILLRLA
jgi:hypothetical protein